MDFSLKFKQCSQWFNSSHGKRVELELWQVLQQMDWTDWKGRFLQIGSIGHNPWLKDLDFASKWILLPYETKSSDIVAHPYEIPLPSQIMDVVFAPFVLDLGVDVQKFLYEVDRILSSMGCVIFIGFNPTSLWRISRFFSWSNKFWYQGRKGCSAWYIKKIMQEWDYDCLQMDFFYFIPPVQNPALIRYFNWVNRLSKIIAFYPPTFYVLKMQKKDKALSGLLPVEKTTWCEYNVKF